MSADVEDTTFAQNVSGMIRPMLSLLTQFDTGTVGSWLSAGCNEAGMS